MPYHATKAVWRHLPARVCGPGLPSTHDPGPGHQPREGHAAAWPPRHGEDVDRPETGEVPWKRRAKVRGTCPKWLNLVDMGNL